MARSDIQAFKGRILVVEDEAIVALDIRKTLARNGFEVTATVPSGEEALACLQEARPDLVLMDIRLQGDLDGLETARLMHEERQIPTIFLTAYIDGEMLQRAKRSSALGYLLKPFEERQLCAAVELALHRHQAEKERRTAEAPPATPDPPTGEAEDLLEIRTLGELTLSRQGKPVLQGHQLSRQLREFLALLLSTPQGSLPQETVQLELWPESTDARARSSFDSLLLRLRRALGEATGDGRERLLLRNGLLSLEGCRIDAREFLRELRAGETAARKGQTGEAANHLDTALDLWKGPFLAGSFRSERIGLFADQLERSFLEASERLGRLRLDEGEAGEAARVLERAFLQDPTHDGLVRLLHEALGRSQQKRRCAELLERHRVALHNAGFSPVEIRAILAGITCQATPPAS